MEVNYEALREMFMGTYCHCHFIDCLEPHDHIGIINQGVEEVYQYLKMYPFIINMVDPYHGLTPLHIAAERDYDHIVDLFLLNGASISVQDFAGLSPFETAVYHWANRSILVFENHAAYRIQRAWYAYKNRRIILNSLTNLLISKRLNFLHI